MTGMVDYGSSQVNASAQALQLLIANVEAVNAHLKYMWFVGKVTT